MMIDAVPSIDKLRWIMAKLRDPDTGCPWDLKQDFSTIVKHTIEEAYEVADAIERQQFDELKGELGDLLFQVVFYSQLAEEQSLFTFDQVIETVCEKLIRRHPHVFANQTFHDEQAIKANWENEKTKERALRASQSVTSMLDDIPQALPALSQANKIQKRCAHVGFDWPNIMQVFDKVEEEVAEVKVELHTSPRNEVALAEEIGDLMFAVVNLARHAKLDPEQVLRQANRKFTARFQQVEALLAAQNKSPQQADLTELEALWQQVKSQK